MISIKTILNEASQLSPADRLLVVDGLLKMLDEPDSTIESIWEEETTRRLAAYKAGKLEVVPLDDVFGGK